MSPVAPAFTPAHRRDVIRTGGAMREPATMHPVAGECLVER